jgi:hypothetical protein
MASRAIITTESKNAECVLKALSVDNGNARIKSEVEGATIKTEVSSESPRTLLSTADDLLRCQIIAENVI